MRMSIQIKPGCHAWKSATGFLAIFGLAYGEPDLVEQIGQEQPVLAIVIHHQDTPVRLPGLQTDNIRRWDFVGLSLRRLQPIEREDLTVKKRTAAHVTLYADFAAHGIYQ